MHNCRSIYSFIQIVSDALELYILCTCRTPIPPHRRRSMEHARVAAMGSRQAAGALMPKSTTQGLHTGETSQSGCASRHPYQFE
jgi:hypothetical protein